MGYKDHRIWQSDRLLCGLDSNKEIRTDRYSAAYDKDVVGGLKSFPSTAIGITAGTTTTETALTGYINEVSVCANANDNVVLPSAVAGMVYYVINHGAANLDIHPADGEYCNEGENTEVVIAANTTALCVCYASGKWEVLELARG